MKSPHFKERMGSGEVVVIVVVAAVPYGVAATTTVNANCLSCPNRKQSLDLKGLDVLIENFEKTMNAKEFRSK